MPPAHRVLVVDPQEIVRRGVEHVFAATDDLRVCGEAAAADEAVRRAAELHPDVVLLDLRLEGSSGVAAIRDIRAARPDARVLVYTAQTDGDALFSAILAGAAGFVLKSTPVQELLDALRTVAAGGSTLDPGVTETVLERLRRGRRVPADERLARLSRRELEILGLVADGHSNAEIAARIHLSEKTVKNHLTRVFDKLEVSRRSEAAAYYHRHGSSE